MSTFIIYTHVVKMLQKKWVILVKGKIKMGEPFGSPLIHVALSVFYLALSYFALITI